MLPNIGGIDSSHVFLQRFEGNLTILPNRPSFCDYLNILNDPSKERLKRYINEGRLRTWQALSMIENRWQIEKRLMEFKNIHVCEELNNGFDFDHKEISSSSTTTLAD